MVNSMRFIQDYVFRHGDILVAVLLVTTIT
jgi:hypothetical protein